ncbi:ribosome assembly RNA-binding protein YhbY [Pseudidiomarina andamanensis]|uniref:Ribosome assembly RNA-binding protein YhbY n=1 Tax=Pseudidiomarina andamanensis TaxID=1940690 RepID=A0AA92EQQ2_9GAMM|nr:ribosome assembly RNA-binding protein YhbY [Pseudidiomarina andamanensis]MDS0217954.1 ribosome assembly RNA-binding protein YhbY [Pseudidiomarina andamanensis]QGT94849.1 ribosome assembly RNA-binding protein YhbY [Pseudidiomarina andamanensis]
MATAVTLSNKQKQHLKSLAHSLKPVVLLGANGLTEGVMAEIELALEHHELIKVKVPDEDREMREKIYATIIAHTGATKVQVVGKILTMYKPSPAAKIQLPRA